MRKPRLGTVLLLLWGIFLTLSVYGYLAWLQPSRLATTVSRMLESKLDVQCRIGEVSLSFLPLPTIHASDLALLRGSVDDLEFHARRARIQLGYMSLLRLKPVIRSISLESPTLDISGDILDSVADRASPEEKREGTETEDSPSLPFGIMGVRVHIENGTCRITGSGGRDHLTISGLNISARLPGLIPGNLELNMDQVRYRNSAGFDMSAADSHLSLSSLRRNHRNEWRGNVLLSTGLQLAALDTVMGHEISAPYRYFPMPEPLKISLTGGFSAAPELGTYGVRGQAAAVARLIMNGHSVPISLSVPFDSGNVVEGMDIENADARMGDDHVTISGRLTGLAQGAPVLNGRADIHHFSLTRWFGFGQAMDVGLQHALDNISGSFEGMVLSPRGVVVPHLKARVQDIDLEGSGSCREFLKPEILISAHAREADLNRIFPELRGEFPDMSHLPPPVLPLSRESHSSSGQSIPVGYDIHISADNADIMNFRVGGADVHVIPSPEDYPMLTIAVGDVYGGKGTSTVHIHDDIRVVASLDRVSMDGLTRALAGYPAVTGLLKKGSADLTFTPGSGLTMLGSLGGSVKAALEQGTLSSGKGGSSVPYEKITVSAQASAAPGKNLKELPPAMDFRGNWNVDIAAGTWSVSAEARQATLAFSTKNGLPVAMHSQPLSLDVTLGRELSTLLAEPLKFTVSGKGSYDAEKNTCSVSKATLRHQDFALSGDLSVNDPFGKCSTRGNLSFSTSSLRTCAALFGLSLPAGSGFKKAEAGANLTVTGDRLSLDGLTGKIDDTAFSGSLQHTLTGRPTLNASLRFPFLNLDNYLPKSGSGSSGRTSTPLPLSFLKNEDMELSLSADRLRAFSTTLTQVSLPVSQKNGTLTAPVRASFPGGGQAEGNFRAALSGSGSSADVSLAMHCRDMNMLKFSRDRGQQTLIAGTGNLDAKLDAVQKHWEDWKHALNGNLALKVANGAIITHAGTQKESRTDFKTMSMNVALDKGRATCRDFLIKGSPVTVTGEGTVDLGTETIDARATVTLAGIPEMPVSITGNLFSPKVTYKLLGAVTGTVGNLGSGVIDLVGGVLTAPFRLFMK